MTEKKRRSVGKKSEYKEERNPLDHMAEFDVINEQLKVTFNIYKDIPGRTYSIPYKWRNIKYRLIIHNDKQQRTLLTIVSCDDADYAKIKTVYIDNEDESLNKDFVTCSKAFVCGDNLILISRPKVFCLNLEELESAPNFSKISLKSKTCIDDVIKDMGTVTTIRYYCTNDLLLLIHSEHVAFFGGESTAVVYGLRVPDLQVIGRISLDPGDYVEKIRQSRKGGLILKCVKFGNYIGSNQKYVRYIVDKETLTVVKKICR
jgi:hypothetical protein